MRIFDQHLDPTMHTMNIDFAMARYAHEDAILREILKTTLDTLSKFMHMNKIKGVLLTGSVASGEGTVVDYNSCLIASDFDFLIYFDLIAFLKNRRYIENLSQEVSRKLVKNGFNTHVMFLPQFSLSNTMAYFSKSSIYEYEFALAAKNIFGKTPSFKKTARPTKEDALELAFTVVSDLVFLKFRKASKIEESYILAKRALTLLNSALIFYGVPVETYEKRIEVAKGCLSKGAFPLGQNDIRILDLFTEYKLSGSLQNLVVSLGFENVDDLVCYQIEFLRKLTTKILFYELVNLASKSIDTNLLYTDSLEKLTKALPNLLKAYSINSRTRSPSRIIGVILYAFGLLSRDRQRKELFATFLFHKQSPKIILNTILTLLFVLNNDSSGAKIVREVFSWINFDDASEIPTVFSLWQVSEKSIKLS